MQAVMSMGAAMAGVLAVVALAGALAGACVLAALRAARRSGPTTRPRRGGRTATAAASAASAPVPPDRVVGLAERLRAMPLERVLVRPDPTLYAENERLRDHVAALEARNHALAAWVEEAEARLAEVTIVTASGPTRASIGAWGSATNAGTDAPTAAAAGGSAVPSRQERRQRRQRRRRIRTAVASVVATLALIAGGSIVGMRVVDARVERNARVALARAGFADVHVRSSALVMRVDGTVADAAAHLRAVLAVRVRGVRRVEDRLHVVARTEPALPPDPIVGTGPTAASAVAAPSATAPATSAASSVAPAATSASSSASTSASSSASLTLDPTA